MINKFNKTINNKFSGFFKFVFFLRYPAAILFVASSLFLIIPQFFDYKKKEQIIMDNLLQNYGLEIKKITNKYLIEKINLKNLGNLLLINL